jgi:periplasmic protein TonB
VKQAKKSFLFLGFCFCILTSFSQKQDTLACSGVYDSTLQHTVYKFVDEMPQYPGGESEMFKVIVENILVPEDYFTTGEIQTKTFASFVVDEKGKVVNIKVLRKTEAEYSPLDKSVINAIRKLADWIPGKCKGVPVAVQFILPLNIDPSY